MKQKRKDRWVFRVNGKTFTHPTLAHIRRCWRGITFMNFTIGCAILICVFIGEEMIGTIEPLI